LKGIKGTPSTQQYIKNNNLHAIGPLWSYRVALHDVMTQGLQWVGTICHAI